jgi:hypothetical protein
MLDVEPAAAEEEVEEEAEFMLNTLKKTPGLMILRQLFLR